MTAIVTGAKGFLGSALCAELKSRGVDVYGIDVDGWDRETPQHVPGAVFYNLAWIGKAGPLRADWRIQLKNVETAMDYFEQAKAIGCSRFICAGTIGEKMIETRACGRLQSQNRFYVNSKNYLHNLLRTVDPGSCKIIWATLGNMYGGKPSGNILDYAIKQIVNGQPATFGPGLQPYDFVHVTDAIRALALMGGGNVRSDEFYVGTGKPRLLKEFLFELGNIMGRPDLIKIGDREDDGTRFEESWFDISRLTEETGYMPETDFNQGVPDYIEKEF